MLHGRLDALRTQAQQRLATALRQTGGTPQARSERESAVALHGDRIALYDAVDNGLCFGRLDLIDGTNRYIGRIGLFDDEGDYEPLLIDWRAPAARPFYLATAAAPDGVRRRRHIRSRLRTVTAIDDELLDIELARDQPGSLLTGEAALLAAITAGRTGRMKDIVQTIQAEQDEVIRAPVDGVLVVQGGPGTGKTAVALHRAAYLLYTHRRELSSRGVLVVGPNATFLRYIAQVLPSLAETGVLLRTPGDLFPGVTARRAESAPVAEIKGRAVMADVIAAAVRDRQEVPSDTVLIDVDGHVLRLTPQICLDAREHTRRSGRLHNLARPLFDTEVVHALAAQIAEEIDVDPYADDPLGGDDAPGDPQVLADADLADIRRELRADPAVQTALDRYWPVLTPQRLLSDLYASTERLAAAATGHLDPSEHDLLWRAPGGGWTPADVALLDEAAELLGVDESAQRARTEQQRQRRLAYAEEALDVLRGSESIDVEDEAEPEILGATDVVDAAALASRQQETDHRTAAERAAADRRWAFGHVVVDEAQELSAMAWRLLMRRCPSRSMTIVGDVAQTGTLAGAASWSELLAPYVADRWRLAELAVSYRTPAEILTVAARVLAAIDPTAAVPVAVRESGVAPRWERVDDGGRLAGRLVELVRQELPEVGGGRLGVIVPAGTAAELGAAVDESVAEVALGDQPDLTATVVVLTVAQAKGLEFDSVLVVDPARILAESPRGHNDLYVALTRATARLGVLYSGDLPAVLADPG
ncbi:AAA family ATPase [Solwaraspora sp. WMMD406]|uniref:HelD family protein n=1 Tax=Solwaraspora sp. WMMD406 TaxID=3016095 RepID=UPI0024166AEE|nr:ATP-binding domain-containing protein [Solwaraspora sp. WMMD406]MDG4766300.1 AAA family ATPase [Solwaraspora sp. WMMD406]